MRYTVDRIEGNFAVCEDESGEMHDIALSELPEGTAEGSVIDAVSGGYVLNSAEEDKRREEIRALEDSLFI